MFALVIKKADVIFVSGQAFIARIDVIFGKTGIFVFRILFD